MVAEAIFAWATSELSVAVATPSAPVGPLGCVSVLCDPVAASTTLAPLTGFPLASFATTVIVAAFAPLAAVTVSVESSTVDCEAETPPTGGGGPPGTPWHVVLPESLNVLPGIPMNFQAYPSSYRYSF